MELSALAALLFWVALALDRSRSWPAELTLPEGGDASHERVTAVVPARNEAQTIGLTLPDLLAQEGLSGVILVDDRSQDDTAEAAVHAVRDRVGEGLAPSLRVVQADETPSGWAGKVHAMASGMGALEQPAPEWILFTDADIHHREGSVRALLAKASEGYDLVSVMARLRAESFWERLLVPTFVFFFQLLYPFRSVSRRDSSVAAAAGGCVLVRRSALEKAGGIESIRGAIIDDVALARRIKSAGGRLWLGLDCGIRSLRAYPRLGDLWRMIARSAYDQLGYRPLLVAGVLIGLGLFFVAPLALLPVGLERLASGVPGAGRAVLWCALALTLQARALLPAVRHHGVAPLYAWVLPISSLLFGAMTFTSAWAHHAGRRISWRDRPAGGARSGQ